MIKVACNLVLVLLVMHSVAQNSSLNFAKTSNKIPNGLHENDEVVKQKFIAAVELLDAINSSFNYLNGILKKDGYWLKITSLNNPTSSDMGFSLENVVQTALKPLLEKAKSTNTQKFNGIVSSILSTPSQTIFGKSLALANPVFPTILSLVSTLTIQEKRITKEDLDSFVSNTSKYFLQYEKLNTVNSILDQNIERLNTRMNELRFDIKEYMIDMSSFLYKEIQRNSIKNMNNEEILLKFLNRSRIEELWGKSDSVKSNIQFPSDGIKSAKDIGYTLQKIFNDYQKTYSENHQQIKSILNNAKTLGRGIKTEQVDASIKEIEELYSDSYSSDILSLRLATVFVRLEKMVSIEQQISK
ncbi:MAG: hypothetical protein ACJ75F_04450 [Flavisolibacter sp.]